jgi:quercetin dioxygenase-like cupin family protein
MQTITDKDMQLVANPANIESLLSYQDGAVVSHTIIKKKNGTLTLFAFEKNEGLSTHSAPYDALVHILEGEAIITIDGKENLLHKDEMIIMPADIPHSVFAKERFKMILTMIKETI